MSVHRFRSTPRAWHQRNPARGRAWKGSIPAALILIGLYALVWGWRIQEVTVEGSTVIPNAAVRDVVLSELQGTWFGVLPRSSMLLARTGRLEQVLQYQFAFASVSARRRLNGALAVRVVEQPIAGIAEFSDGGLLLVSAKGNILGPVPESLNGAANVMHWRLTRGPMKTGDVFLPPEHVALLQSLWAVLAQAAGGALQPQFIGQREDSETTFDIHTAQGTVISVSADDRGSDQLTKLRSVVRDLYRDSPSRTLRSIDLRYGDRVYVQ